MITGPTHPSNEIDISIYNKTSPLTKLEILKRKNEHEDIFKTDLSRLIYPIIPYHKRLENYIQKRNSIFKVSEISSYKKPKRSTLRLIYFYKKRKLCRK